MSEKQHEITLLIEKVTKLTEGLELLLPKLEAVLERVVVPSRSIPMPDLSLLTGKQRDVFNRIGKVAGTDVRAIRKVEKILNELKNERVNEGFGRLLGQIIRERGWGVQCSCGEIGRPMWQVNKRCAQGGLLVISHKTGSQQMTHDSSTTFKGYSIVPRPDKRLKGSRRN